MDEHVEIHQFHGRVEHGVGILVELLVVVFRGGDYVAHLPFQEGFDVTVVPVFKIRIRNAPDNEIGISGIIEAEFLYAGHRAVCLLVICPANI